MIVNFLGLNLSEDLNKLDTLEIKLRSSLYKKGLGWPKTQLKYFFYGKIKILEGDYSILAEG